jgi:large subunit ribosomal protein L4
MSKITVYNLEGKEAGSMELAPEVFGVELKADVVQFVVRAQQANAFIPYAHTKTRGEVRGGGRKPWKQKGTGRARHGSSRSPIWVGGGVTFGPRNTKNPSLKINKKTKSAAARMVLSDKLSGERLIVVESFDGATGKTKQFSELLKKLANGRSALIATADKNQTLQRACSNIPKTNTVLANSLNVRDLLKYQYLVVDKAGVEALTKQYHADNK